MTWTIDKSGGAQRIDLVGNVTIKPLPNKQAMVRKILCALFSVRRWTNEGHGDYKRLLRYKKVQLVDFYIKAEKIVHKRITKQAKENG